MDKNNQTPKQRNKKQETDIDVLKNIEEQMGVGNESIPTLPEVDEDKQQVVPTSISHQNPNVNQFDGYIKIERYDLPQNGVLYPETWEFAYKCPDTGDVAVFSTLHEQDQPAIMAAIDDLIRKNVYIFDSSNDNLISTGEVCDAHKVYFMLRLREFYLSNYPIPIETICDSCHEPYTENMYAQSLLYNDIPEKLLQSYDGRVFHLHFNDVEEDVLIRIPTLETTSKIFKHIVRVYRDKDKEKKGGTSKANKIFYDKKFLLIAPYLFVEGNETIASIVKKFDDVSKNQPLFKRYTEFISRVKFENQQEIESTCKHCGSPEVAEIKFPTWNKLFVNDTDDSGYYD
jgi:hypothetical protein